MAESSNGLCNGPPNALRTCCRQTNGITPWNENLNEKLSLDTDEDLMNAMARQLAEKAGDGDSADAVWRELD